MKGLDKKTAENEKLTTTAPGSVSRVFCKCEN